MARLAELERGIWIEGLDEDIGHEVESLCCVMESNLTDADRARQLERRRCEELEAQEPERENEWHSDRITRIYERAKRDVIRANWEVGEIPASYVHRLPFLYARTFLTSLAQLGRTMGEMAKLDTGDAKTRIVAARNQFDRALPHIKPVRDSIEHAEDRMRGLNRDKDTMTLAPISNQMIEAPGGGVLVGDTLIDRHYGCTVNDGSYAEVEVADDTLEVARVAIQEIYDALPWRPGHRRFSPSP